MSPYLCGIAVRSSGTCRYGEGHVGDGALGDVDTVHQLLGVHVDRIECEAVHDFLLILVQSSLKIQLSFFVEFPAVAVFILSFLVQTLSALIGYTAARHT